MRGVDQLVIGLAAPDPATRCEAARALRALCHEAAGAVPALARALRDGGCAAHLGDYVTVAECAADALEAIGAPAVPALLDALGDATSFDVPVMCYDQGAYIGDYASRTVSAGELAAASLRRLIARDARYVDLVAELGKSASDEDVKRWIARLRSR